MKPNITLFLFLFASLIPKILHCQTAGTTCHEAIIPLQIREHESLCIFKDTIIFEEHFEHFLSEQINDFTPIGGTSCLYTLPRSLTQKPYCRARDITIKSDSSHNAYCQLFQGDAFATPKLDIPIGSVLEVRVQAVKSKRYLLINNNEVEVKEKDSLIKMPLQALEEIMISRKNHDFNIYSITITTPRDVLSLENYVLSNDTLRIHNLSLRRNTT